jgi:hypothetical protein
VTVAVPGATPVKIATQLPPDKAQLAATVPTAVFEDTKFTLPVGVLAGVVVSATVAVQVEVPPMLIEARLQTTVVVVASFGFTVMALEVLGPLLL